MSMRLQKNSDYEQVSMDQAMTIDDIEDLQIRAQAALKQNARGHRFAAKNLEKAGAVLRCV